MSITVLDGDTIELDPLDLRVIRFDWDTENLALGALISTSKFRVSAVRPDGIAVTSITRSGAVATVITAAAHGYVTNDWVAIEGADQSDYNVTVQVTVINATTFTYAVANSPATPATGTTITAAFGLGIDSVSILSASPYNSRSTQVRLIGSGIRALGKRFDVSNTIVTNETPAQTKDRFISVVIADL